MINPSLRDALVRKLRECFTPYAVLSVDPPVFYVPLVLDHPESFFPAFHLLFSSLAGRKSYCLCAHTWALTEHVFRSVRRHEADCRREFPDLELIHQCNEPGDTVRFAAAGARAVFCNHNCFLDDSIFRPLPNPVKRLDAVYDARLVEFKRHFLARDVVSLAFIYFPSAEDNAAFVRKLSAEFSHAHFFNRVEPDGFRLLRAPEINEALNACRVGLCLSAEEGAMWASGQYLLCGLPVVTTPSLGGRAEFFEDGFVATVPPEPGAIKEAVAEMIARALDPAHIREVTIKKIQAHRTRFIAAVQEIYDRHGVRRVFANEWKDVFVNKLVRNHNHLVTIESIREAEAARGGNSRE